MVDGWTVGLRRRMVRVTAGVALAGALALPVAGRAESRNLGEQVGLGLASGLGTLVYFPVKAAYSTVGGVVGGLTYAVTLGDEATAKAVWGPTLGGTYVLTPDIVAGQESVEFFGEPKGTGRSGSSDGQWPD